jgi:hypothetical protein
LTQLTSDKSAQVAQEARNNLVQGWSRIVDFCQYHLQ